MRGGPAAEKRPAQRIIMLLVSISFVALLVIPALDHRFKGSTVPLWVSVFGDVLVAVGFYFITLCIGRTHSRRRPLRWPITRG
jgi:protein-S-isoprenylcysteine O-methyltransferase Ste14